MPKGRQFVPSGERDGIWYCHREGSCVEPILRRTHTTSGIMMSDSSQQPRQRYPPQPIQPFEEKLTGNFKSSNQFSVHDNRHSHEDHGVYFGNGQDTRYYGRLLTSSSARQHHTKKDFLKHYGRHTINHDYHTLYRKDFESLPTEETPNCRRYAKNHSEGTQGLARLSTETLPQFNDDPGSAYETKIKVLATSQQPFLKHNKWKYSYQGLPKCYPALPNKVKKPYTAMPFCS